MEILDKILEINTYTELISYFKEVISQLGKTRINLQALVVMNSSRNTISGIMHIFQSVKMNLL